MSSIIIAEYLDDEEAFALREKLKSEGLNSFVKWHGLPRFFGVEVNYRVFVDRTDFDNARQVFERFQSDCTKKRNESKLLLSMQCPQCKSTLVTNIEKTSLLQKIRFFGVTVWKCKECGSEWYT
jgi:hypothetical protein